MLAAKATLLGAPVPIAGIAGDQQAALFGQGCFEAGEAKATYGTGTFVLVALGEEPGRGGRPPDDGGGGRARRYRRFAAEGSVLVGGAALQWLRDGLGLIASAAESERLATRSSRPRASPSCPRSRASARRSGGPTRGG